MSRLSLYESLVVRETGWVLILSRKEVETVVTRLVINEAENVSLSIASRWMDWTHQVTMYKVKNVGGAVEVGYSGVLG